MKTPESSDISGDASSPIIRSVSNARIKRIRALLRRRRERDATGLCFVEGLHLVAHAVSTGTRIETLVVAPELLSRCRYGRDLLDVQARNGVHCLAVTPEVFESLTPRRGDHAHGIGAVVRQRWERIGALRPGGPELCWAALESTQYPGNLGTILRTLDAVGGAGVILLGNTADPYDPKAVHASLGAVFSQRLVRATLPEFLAWKERYGLSVVGTSPAGSADYRGTAYYGGDSRTPLVLFLGGERRGLPPAYQAVCDVTVRIPMAGRCDSLNLSVATSIVLYEIYHQRHGGGDIPPATG